MPWNPAQWLSVWLLAGLFGSTAFRAWDDEGRDLNNAPASVTRAAREAAPDARLDCVTWYARPGLVAWYVSGRDAQGRWMGVLVDVTGKVMQIVTYVTMDDLKSHLRELIAKSPVAGSIVQIREIQIPTTGVIDYECLGKDDSGRSELLFVIRKVPAAK